VMATLRAVPGATVQVLGWDEAFVGVETADPETVARQIQADVLTATGLHCSVGIGDTTTRAKVATELGKPRGVAVLTRETWLPTLGDRPTTAVWGVGPRVASRLAGLGIRTVSDLAHADPDALAAEFGPTMGPHYGRLGRGGGYATVDDTPWVARAHGRETTYQHDLTSPEEIAAAVHELATQVADDIAREDRPCVRVHLKVRFAPFFTVQRSRKLAEPTGAPEQIARTALDLLQRLDDHRPIRLLGIRAEMAPPEGGY
jgi:DNA polymerase-4